MACTDYNVPEIEKTECIGNSLDRINTNFSTLKTFACDNFGTIEFLQASIANLDSRIVALSGITVPGTAKAWVKFDGRREEDPPNLVSVDNTNRFIYSSYNISYVYRLGRGDYEIVFAPQIQFPRDVRNYLVLGTSSQTQASNNLYTWLQPYDYRSKFVRVRVASVNAANTIDAEHISVVIY